MGIAACNLGYDFDFVTFKKDNQKEWTFYEKNGCHARWIEKPRLRLIRWGINKEVASKEFLQQYDLVITREYYQFMTYLITKNHSNAVIYNGPYWDMFRTKLFSKMFDALFTTRIIKNAKYVFNKSELATEFLRTKGYRKQKTIGVALDTTRFDNELAPSEDTKELMDFMRNNDCLLYVGRIDKNKNYSFLLSVYEKLLINYPKLKFIVIGKSKQDGLQKLMGKSDESYEQECYKKFSTELRDGIIRIQRIDNTQLKYIYPLCKAFLLPSKKEIFGMVMLEAMYLGAPVVTTRNGGSTTLIKNQNTGIMLDDFDITEWANSISRLLEDKKYCDLLIDNAKNMVTNKYNWKSIIKDIVETVENLDGKDSHFYDYTIC